MADEITPADIGALVAKTLSPPVMGMGGGSATEERAQGRWLAECRSELARIRAALGSPARAPEAFAYLDVAAIILRT